MSEQHRCSQSCICAACEDTKALARRATAAEAALDALRAQVREVIGGMRLMARVADRAAMEHRDHVEADDRYRARADARFATYAAGWADSLTALLDPPSGGPQR